MLKGRLNSSLNNFQGLESLTSIGGDFLLYGNYNASSLTGLENLVSIGRKFRIFYSNLNDCAFLVVLICIYCWGDQNSQEVNIYYKTVIYTPKRKQRSYYTRANYDIAE